MICFFLVLFTFTAATYNFTLETWHTYGDDVEGDYFELAFTENQIPIMKEFLIFDVVPTQDYFISGFIIETVSIN